MYILCYVVGCQPTTSTRTHSYSRGFDVIRRPFFGLPLVLHISLLNTYLFYFHYPLADSLIFYLILCYFPERRKHRQARLAGTKIPDLRTQEAVQKFFLSEIQLGEDLLQQGEIDQAVEHLGSAIAVCGHPTQLIQIFQSTLPPQVFHILLQRLPMIGQVSEGRRPIQSRQLALIVF